MVLAIGKVVFGSSPHNEEIAHYFQAHMVYVLTEHPL